MAFSILYNIYIISGLLGVRGKRKKEKKEMKGEGDVGEMQGRFSVACLRRFDSEMTSNCDDISKGDSLQRGEHFYKVGFSIP